jgi:outer membrane receptor for ferrienterochelin and colicins
MHALPRILSSALSPRRSALLVLALFCLPTAGQGIVLAQTAPDAGQPLLPDAAPPTAAALSDASADELSSSNQEPPATAPLPAVQTDEQMPTDLMVAPSDDLLMSREPSNRSPQELSLEALFNIDISIASKSLMKQSEAPSIVTVITRSMIEALGFRSVAEALRDVPGFYVIDDGVTSNVTVRGVNAGPNSWSRIIKVMVDGHPVTDYSTGGTFLGPELIPIEAVESIEVIRGAGSALYGANAFLGVVNIVTRKPKEPGTFLQAGVEPGLVRSNLSWKTNGNLLGSVTFGDKPKSYLLVAVHHDEFDRSGLHVPSGSPSAQDYAGLSSQGDVTRPTSVFAKGVFDLGSLGDLAAQYHLQRLDAMAEFSDLSILTHNTRIVRSNNIAGADHNLHYFGDAFLLHTYGTYTVTQDLPDQTLDVADPIFTYRRERMDRTYQVGSELSYRYKRNSALLGAEYMSTYDTGDTVYQVVRETPGAQNGGSQILFASGHPMDISNKGVFAQGIWYPHKKVGLTGGLRYDWNDRFGNSLNGRGALVIQWARSLYTKALFGTSFVPPTPTQLYAVPLRFDGGVKGNETLKNQKAYTTELQLGYKAKEFLEAAVNGFYTVIDHRIEFEQLGNQMEAMNLSTSHSWGVELASYLNRKPLFARLSASYESTTSDVPSPTPQWWNRLYSTSGAGGDQSLGYPQLMGNATFGVTFPQYHFETALSGRAVGSRKTSAANSYAGGKAYLLDSYYLVDFNASTLEARLIGRRLTRFSVHVNNIFNRKYAEPGYLGVDIPSGGIGAFLSITQELEAPSNN